MRREDEEEERKRNTLEKKFLHRACKINERNKIREEGEKLQDGERKK